MQVAFKRCLQHKLGLGLFLKHQCDAFYAVFQFSNEFLLFLQRLMDFQTSLFQNHQLSLILALQFFPSHHLRCCSNKGLSVWIMDYEAGTKLSAQPHFHLSVLHSQGCLGLELVLLAFSVLWVFCFFRWLFLCFLALISVMLLFLMEMLLYQSILEEA